MNEDEYVDRVLAKVAQWMADFDRKGVTREDAGRMGGRSTFINHGREFMKTVGARGGARRVVSGGH